MARARPSLGTPFGTDGPWLAAILDVLGDLHDLLDQRLPQAERAGDPVKVSEPAPADVPPKAVRVSEPAPDNAPSGAEPAMEPDPDNEPEPDPVKQLPEPPPRAGRGSSLKAWQAWADAAQVSYDAEDTRDDVIAACELAGVLPDEQ